MFRQRQSQRGAEDTHSRQGLMSSASSNTLYLTFTQSLFLYDRTEEPIKGASQRREETYDSNPLSRCFFFKKFIHVHFDQYPPPPTMFFFEFCSDRFLFFVFQKKRKPHFFLISLSLCNCDSRLSLVGVVATEAVKHGEGCGCHYMGE